MEAATVEQATEQPDEGAPVEEGAEATRTVAHLFQYSKHVDEGVGATECEHREDGQCQDAGHFHAWLSLPNALQRDDIREKARAARARRKRALRDATPSDAYVILEAELDELMAQERGPLLRELAEREARKSQIERIRDLIEQEERFNNYWQDAEEHARLRALSEEERPAEEFDALDALVSDFEATLDKQSEELADKEVGHLQSFGEDGLREKVRQVRIAEEIAEVHMRAYYLWLGFICTKSAGNRKKRYFEHLEDYRNAPPEVVRLIESTLRDLEGRQARGDAAGN